MNLWRYVPAALLLSVSAALGQSTATPVLPGSLTTSGCPSGYTACYLPYSNSNPLPVSGGGGGGAVYGPTANGSPAANPPVLMGGTANGTGTGNVENAKVSSAGALSVDGSGVTQPVSGSVSTLQGSVVSPTDSAGNDATDTVNHAVKVNVVAGGVAQGSTTSGQTGSLVQGAVTTSAPSYTNAQTSPLSLTTAGAVRVDNSANTQPDSPRPAAAGVGAVLKCVAQIKATATACGTSAGHNLIGWHIGNAANSAASYVQLFNVAAGSVTLGTTTPDDVIDLPANGGNNWSPPFPISYGTALTFACTTTPTGSTAPASNCDITLIYN